jgi:predicted N-acetyltransferase YhbS
MTTAPRFTFETPADAPGVDALIARAFGPGRFAKTAERLREGGAPILDLSAVAWTDDGLVGCARMWPVAIGGAPALMLGPFAVDAAYRSLGLGAALIEQACNAAAAAGHGLVLLVGDEAYFSPLGFSAASARRVVMPGPVDQRRVLVRALIPGAEESAIGLVTIRRVDSAASPLHQSPKAKLRPAAQPLEVLPSGV